MKRGSAPQEYINEIYKNHETPLMAWVKSELVADGKDKISVGISEGLVLKFFSSQKNVDKIVEIGTLYGYSALWFLEGLKPSGLIYTLEKNPEHVAKTKLTFSKLDNRSKQIKLIEGDANENLAKIEPHGPFDLVLIDANKSSYADYYDWAVENTNSGGYILIDNAYMFGSVWDDMIEVPAKMKRTLKELNVRVANDDRVMSFSIPTTEGLTVLRKN